MKPRTRVRKIISEYIILVGTIGVLFFLFFLGWNDYEEKAQECDKARGYICTHYEVRQYLIKGE